MKLSELLKNNPEVSSGVNLPPAPPVPPKKPAQHTEKPAETSKTSSENLENKIREGIEKEFFEKMRVMEAEIKRLTEQRLDEERRLMESREKALEVEKHRLAEELETLKTANQNLSSERISQEREAQRRMAEERERLEKEMREQAREALRKKEEELQAEIRKKEQEVLEEKKRLEEAARENILKASQPPAAELPEAKVPENKPADRGVPPPQVSPVKFPDISSLKLSETAPPPISPNDVFILDSKTEERLRKIYQTLAQVGEDTFEKLLRSGKLEGDYIRRLLSEIYDLMEKHDQDFLTIVLEPYGSSSYFSFHSANCAILSTIIGQELKMSAEEVKELALASFLHDVGLLGIRENLDYPKPLTTELKSEILKHPERGAALLGDSVSENVTAAILQHHETMNGKGYPKALTGEEIHPYAKIMQVVDAFEAMTHHRPYRQKPFEVSEALREMVDRGRGVYDRDAMKALMSRIGLYPVLSLVELSNHKIARVVRQSRKFPLSPIVRIEFDEDGNKLKAPFMIDLSKNQLIHIHAPVGSSASYGKERIEKEMKEEPKKTLHILEFIPFLLILGILAVVAYIILKL